MCLQVFPSYCDCDVCFPARCMFNTSYCDGVGPGEICMIDCAAPFVRVGNWTTGQCPKGNRMRSAMHSPCQDLNTDPLQELDYFPLTCLLESCPDPSPWPIGSLVVQLSSYNKTADGKWVCAAGYNGTARNRCELGESWQTAGHAIRFALTGCSQVVPCLAPVLTGLDRCTYDDVSACTSVSPGDQCEVHCRSPFTGAKTEATSADLALPKPRLIAFPSSPKDCEPTESCEIRAVLSGCLQVVPCKASDTHCRFDFSDCLSVLPNSECRVTCNGDNGFAGSSTVGVCLQGNTDVNGLVYTEPVCQIMSCSDPPDGNGYVKGEYGWKQSAEIVLRAEEDKEQWGLLDKSFSGHAQQKGPDHHLEARASRLPVEEEIKEKTREEQLYEVPSNLQPLVPRMSWVAGLAEVALPVEYKLKNIEDTDPPQERAKREYLYGDAANSKQPCCWHIGLEPLIGCRCHMYTFFRCTSKCTTIHYTAFLMLCHIILQYNQWYATPFIDNMRVLNVAWVPFRSTTRNLWKPMVKVEDELFLWAQS
eukprot:Skav219924  [mRNA]  locus=scaffold2006:213687:233286:+ [translate_table: standard]